MTTQLPHLIFSTPNETFLAIEASPGRLPMTNLKCTGSFIQWQREDGGVEAVDLEGSEFMNEVLSNFYNKAGLLVAIYDNLADKEVGSMPDFVVISASGLVEDEQMSVPADAPRA